MKKTILASSMAMVLAGCGGDGVILTEQNPQPKAGEPLFVTTKVDGKEVIKETYRYYAVNDSGRLVAEPKPEYENSPHIALLESRKMTTMSMVSAHTMTVHSSDVSPINGVEMRIFIEDTLAALRVYYPKLSMNDLLRQLVDYDQAFEALLEDYKKSGFNSVAQYVNFYEAIDLGGENDEAEADRFILLNDMTTAEFLAKINTQGVSWQALLESMKNQNIKFSRLYVLYISSRKPIDVFIYDFVHANKTSTTTRYMSSQDVSFEDTADAWMRATRLGMWIEKYTWDFIRNSQPTKEFNSLLSNVDFSNKNYTNGIINSGSSPTIEFEATTPDGNRIFHTKFILEGSFSATNYRAPGYWIPVLSFNTTELSNEPAWNINANAAITFVEDRGLPGTPEPEVKIIANVKANNSLQIFSKSHTFYANGRSGFRVE